jgi:hypothetical protein
MGRSQLAPAHAHRRARQRLDDYGMKSDSLNNPLGAGNPLDPGSPKNPYGRGWRIEGR